MIFLQWDWVRAIADAADPRPLRERALEPRPPVGVMRADDSILLGDAARQYLVSTRDLPKVRCLGLDLRDAQLEAVQFSEASFVACDLRRARLAGAILEGACVCSSILEHADLRGAHLDASEFAHVFAYGADFRNAHVSPEWSPSFEQCDLRAITWTESRPLPIRATDCAFGAEGVARGLNVLTLEDRSGFAIVRIDERGSLREVFDNRRPYGALVRDRFGRRVALAKLRVIEVEGRVVAPWEGAEAWDAYLDHVDLSGLDMTGLDVFNSSLNFADLRGTKIRWSGIGDGNDPLIVRGSLVDAATVLPEDLDQQSAQLVRV